MIPDAAQRLVIEAAPTSSAAVIGAPGTGKTRTLQERLIALVQQGRLAPDEVLALTPSRQTATRMRDWLGVRLGLATPGALARSVGSFAFQIVRHAAVAAGKEPPALLTGADQDRIIAELLSADAASAWPEHIGETLRASPSFRSELREFMAECTQLGIGSAALRAAEDPIWRAAGAFLDDYGRVMSWMRAAHRDSAELLAEAAAIVAGGEDLGALQSLRMVLIDDAQELTRGGVQLMRALRERDIAVIAFGDPDIASGAFRGASPERFAELASHLGEVWVLGTAHRQSEQLCWVSRRLTQVIGAGGRVDHRMPPGPEPEPDGSVRTLVAASPHEEVDLIAGALRQWHLADGIGWSQLAVIAHDGAQVSRLETELAAREVPTRAAGVQRPLGSEPIAREIAEIVLLGQTAPAERDPDALAHALRSPFGGLDAVSLRRLRSRLRQHELAADAARPATELLREAMAHPASLALIDAPEARVAERFAETLAQIHAAADESPHELLWRVWDRARAQDGRGLASVLRQAAEHADAEANRALDALVALFGAAKRFGERSPGEPAAVFLAEMLGSEVPEDSLSAAAGGGTVTVLTPAAALGTEFEAVVVAGVQEGVWPNTRLRGGELSTWRLADPDSAAIDRRRTALHDELRLFVRAISRARSRLLITAVGDEDGAPSPFLDLLPRTDQSAAHPASDHPLTLRGLVARHRRTLTGGASAAERAHAAEQLAILAREGVPGADPAQWYGMLPPSSTAPLADPVQHPVRVSPSLLESFEACALNWVIGALGGAESSTAGTLGTVLHAAAERVPAGGADALRAVVDERWGELQFDAEWIAQRERRWAETLIDRLDAYLGRVQDEGGHVAGKEARFELLIELDAEGGPRVIQACESEQSNGARAVLSGVVDRIEVYPPGRGEKLAGETSQLVIVDLKTGKGESRYLDRHVADHAQLAAYQLAFREGAIPGLEGAEGAALGGSRLLLIGVDQKKGEHYRIAHQSPQDAEQHRAFLDRIAADARGMAGSIFLARVQTHCVEERFAVCRIHTIPAVSAP